MTRTRLTATLLGTMAVAFTAAFLLLPMPVASALSGQSYGDEQHLTVRVSSAFSAYWHVGRGALTPELSHLVEYWRGYLAVKAVTAIGLTAVSIVLATRIWTTYARAGTHPRARAAATAGVAVTVLSVVAFLVALADVQGTFAPFSSLMSMLPVTSAHGDLAVMIGQVRHDLAHYPNGSSGALQTMVGDLAHYHAVVAVLFWVTAVVLIVLMVAWWRRDAPTIRVDRRARRLFGLFAIASGLLAALVAVLGLANTTSAVDSPTAVLNFYKGSF